QYVLEWSRSPKVVMRHYQDDFMGKIELLSKVTKASRMRIALDLVLKPFNKRKDEIISKAFVNIKNTKEQRRNLVRI
ncbi:hypothetical protein SESBI_36514, partial [Sesbania bispinosa]